jgi:hypothetical protein
LNFFSCCFVCLIIVGFYLYFYSYFLFFLSILSTLPSSSSHRHSHFLHSPSLSCAKIHRRFLPNSFVCPFSSIFSPCAHLPQPFSPNLSSGYPSLLCTHHLLTNLLYQLLHNPSPVQSLTQAPYTITTEIHPNNTRATKPSSPHTPSPTHLPHFLPPPLVLPYLSPQISIASLTIVYLPNSHYL